MASLTPLIKFVKTDLTKLVRFGTVSLIMVPLGTCLFWLLLQTALHPAIANFLSVTLSAIPNYLLNRYWVWSKRGVNSLSREIAPFWLFTMFSLLLSTGAVAIANGFTDSTPIFLAVSFCVFGLMWLLKFFLLEKYLFAT